MTKSLSVCRCHSRWFAVAAVVGLIGCGSDASSTGSSSARSSAPSSKPASSAPKASASVMASALATASALAAASSSAPSSSAVAQASASSAPAITPPGAWPLLDLPGPTVEHGPPFTGSYGETVLVPKGWKQTKGGADTLYREDRAAFFVFYNINASKLDDKRLETILAFAPLKASKIATKSSAEDQVLGKDAIHCRVGEAAATVDDAPATVTWVEYATVMRGEPHSSSTDHLVWVAVEKDGSPEAVTNEVHAIFASLTKPKESCGSGSLCP